MAIRLLIVAICLTMSSALAAPTSVDFCANLTLLENLTTDDYEQLEREGNDRLDVLVRPSSVSKELTGALPDRWLEYQIAVEIASCYVAGYTIDKDVDKAMSVLEAPAADGYRAAQHMLASLQVFESDDPQLQRTGFQVLQAEAEDGSTYSAGKLGWAYALGRGASRDERRALELYLVAANAGMTYWQDLLSHAYERGYYGLPIDPEQAAYWREFEPKIHVTTYECEIAINYARGLFPPNTEQLERYRAACEAAD